MADSPNYYELLGVERNASVDEIKAAYKKMAKKYHPDLHPGDKEAEEMFKKVNEANQTLTDPDKKAAYDYELDHPGMSGAGGMGGNPFSGMGGEGFGDIFGDIFGGMFGGGGRARRADTTGSDVTVEVELSFLDAVKGCTKEVRYSHLTACPACKGTGAKNGTEVETCSKCRGQGVFNQVRNTMFGSIAQQTVCPDCGGTGKHIKEKCPDCRGRGLVKQEAVINITIPAGVDKNSYMSKNGAGNAGANGGASGNLIITFRLLEHELLKRDKLDLRVEVPISYKTAVLGGKILVPGIDEMIEYEIPEGTQPGTTFILRGKGIRTNRGTGNLYVTVNIEVPTRVTRDQSKKLEAFDDAVDKQKQCSKMRNFADQTERLYGKKPY